MEKSKTKIHTGEREKESKVPDSLISHRKRVSRLHFFLLLLTHSLSRRDWGEYSRRMVLLEPSSPPLSLTTYLLSNHLLSSTNHCTKKPKRNNINTTRNRFSRETPSKLIEVIKFFQNDTHTTPAVYRFLLFHCKQMNLQRKQKCTKKNIYKINKHLRNK